MLVDLDEGNQRLLGLYSEQISRIEQWIEDTINQDEQAKQNHELA